MKIKDLWKDDDNKAYGIVIAILVVLATLSFFLTLIFSIEDAKYRNSGYDEFAAQSFKETLVIG